jgi:CheY-like chemotaxis protein
LVIFFDETWSEKLTHSQAMIYVRSSDLLRFSLLLLGFGTIFMPNVNATELLREAMAAARADDRTKTRELLRQVVRLDPENETAWQWLAGVAESNLEATNALEQVLRLNPAHDKAKTALRAVRAQAGIEAAKAKDVPTAQRLLRKVVADDPNNEHAWFYLASVVDSPYEGLVHLQRVLMLNPNHSAAKKGIDYYQAKISKLNESGFPAPNTPMPAPLSGKFTIGSVGVAQTQLPAMILVVDQSRTVRKAIALATASDNITVVEAEDAEEASERLREQGAPDLILLDVNLPRIDGYEFTRVVRQSSDMKPVPVVLFTSKEHPFDKNKARSSGVDAYLNKPFDFAALQRAICVIRSETPVAV